MLMLMHTLRIELHCDQEKRDKVMIVHTIFFRKGERAKDMTCRKMDFEHKNTSICLIATEKRRTFNVDNLQTETHDKLGMRF